METYGFIVIFKLHSYEIYTKYVIYVTWLLYHKIIRGFINMNNYARTHKIIYKKRQYILLFLDKILNIRTLVYNFRFRFFKRKSYFR